MTELVEEKSAFRIKLKKLLLTMSPEEKKKADGVIFQKLLLRPEVINAKTICCYVSFGTEVDTKHLITRLSEMGKIVIEPEKAANKSMDLFIVPGLGFDRKLHRLGRGGGFYDRLMAKITVPKIALTYECQVLAEVPYTSYDVPITALITEEES